MTGTYHEEKAKVERLFKKYPETRDSYVLLVLRYYAEYHGIDIFRVLGVNEVRRLPSPETITRLSRVIQNDDKKFQPTQDATKNRNEAMDRFLRPVVTR